MAYETPKNLRHEKRIAFGLSFPQLFWPGSFGVMFAVVYLKPGLCLRPGWIGVFLVQAFKHVFEVSFGIVNKSRV